MIYKLGVTGGIGSGKSTICKIFEVMGIAVFYSDDEARYIMDSSAYIKTELNSLLGFDIYKDGELDRPALACLIFNDKNLLAKVNKLVHPVVFESFKNWSEQQPSKYVILESAILFESGSDRIVNFTLAVSAPLEERIQRVMSRNNISRDQVMERIGNQIGEDDLVSRSDFVVNNDESALVLPAILEIHKHIIEEINAV